MMMPPIPGWILAGWRVLLTTLVALYAIIATEVVRGLVGGFGMRVGGLIVIALATLIAMLAILPSGAFIDLPEALWQHWIPERRWRVGRCPVCNYGVTGSQCTECGAAFERPPAYTSNWHTLRRAAWIIVPAWALGIMAGLVLIHLDEAAFQREVISLRSQDDSIRTHARRRAWPANFSELNWTAGVGFSGPPPFDSPKTLR